MQLICALVLANAERRFSHDPAHIFLLQCNCTAYHFACCLPEEVGEVIRTALVDAGIDTTIKDVVSLLPEVSY